MNKLSRIWMPTLAAAALMGVFAVSASAQPMNRMVKELSLTDEQQQNLADISAEFRPSREQARAQRAAMREARGKGDTQAVAEMAANAARQRAYHEAEMRQRIAEVLTPEQLAQWDTLRESGAMDRKGDHDGGGRGKGQRKGSRGERSPGDSQEDIEEGVQG